MRGWSRPRAAPSSSPQAALTEGARCSARSPALLADPPGLAAMGERARSLAVPAPARHLHRAAHRQPRERRAGTPSHGTGRVIAGLILPSRRRCRSRSPDRPTNPACPRVHVAGGRGILLRRAAPGVELETDPAEPASAQALSRGRVAAAATSLDAALQYAAPQRGTRALVFGLTVAPPVAVLVPARGRRTRSPRPVRPHREDRRHHRAGHAGRARAVRLAGPRARPCTASPSRASASAAWPGRSSPARSPRRRCRIRGRRGCSTRGERSPWWISESRIRRRSGSGARRCTRPVFVSADTKLGRAELSPFARAMLRAVARTSRGNARRARGKTAAPVVGSPEDFALRLRGARDNYLPTGASTRTC